MYILQSYHTYSNSCQLGFGFFKESFYLFYFFLYEFPLPFVMIQTNKKQKKKRRKKRKKKVFLTSFVCTYTVHSYICSRPVAPILFFLILLLLLLLKKNILKNSARSIRNNLSLFLVIRTGLNPRSRNQYTPLLRQLAPLPIILTLARLIIHTTFL